MIRMTKIVKMIGILLIIGLGIYVIVYLIIQSLFIDVNKIHNFQNIKDFEKYSHLSFMTFMILMLLSIQVNISF